MAPDQHPRSNRRRRGRTGAVVLVTLVVAALVGTVVVLRSRHRHHEVLVPNCLASAGGASYQLDLEQAANAATISAVGKRMGLADHAVTIALAAAMQESRLRNLSFGDRDSLGLFQQRPSQGWGTAAQVMTPRYASTAFYQHLVKVVGWETLAVTDSAQRVQHSAAPDAYAQWEDESRVLAQALTGEVPAGLACRFDAASWVTAPGTLSDAMARELGPPTLGVAVTPARGWTVATWLVGHAAEYRITSVAFAGQRWTAAGGGWTADPKAGGSVLVVTTPPGHR